MTEPTLTDWNELKDQSLVYRINNEILHPLGYAAVLNTETGTSDRVLIANDVFEFAPEAHNKHKNNVTMTGLLATHKVVEQQIASKFGLQDIWHNLVDCTDKVFVADNSDLEKAYEFQYADTENEITEGDCYAIEVYGTSVWISDDEQFLLTACNDGCGNRDMYLFALKNLSNVEMY